MQWHGGETRLSYKPSGKETERSSKLCWRRIRASSRVDFPNGALEEARRRGNSEIVELLEAHVLKQTN